MGERLYRFDQGRAEALRCQVDEEGCIRSTRGLEWMQAAGGPDRNVFCVYIHTYILHVEFIDIVILSGGIIHNVPAYDLQNITCLIKQKTE